jgi:HK97 family phage major capsid protein
MNLKEMQDKREQLVSEARQALDEIKSNTDESRAQELEQRHDTIMGDLDKLDGNIAREERVAAAEKSLDERREREARGRARSKALAAPKRAASQGRDHLSRGLLRISACAGSGRELSAEERAVLSEGYQTVEGAPRRPRTRPAATPCRPSCRRKSSAR